MRCCWLTVLCLLVVQCDSKKSAKEEASSDDRSLKIVSADQKGDSTVLTVQLEDDDEEVVTNSHLEIVVQWKCGDDDFSSDRQVTATINDDGTVKVTLEELNYDEAADCVFRVSTDDSEIDGQETDAEQLDIEDSTDEEEDSSATTTTCSQLQSTNSCAGTRIYNSTVASTEATASNYDSVCCQPRPTEETTCAQLQNANSCGKLRVYNSANASTIATANNYDSTCCQQPPGTIALSQDSPSKIYSSIFTGHDQDYSGQEFGLTVSGGSALVKLNSSCKATLWLHNNNMVKKVPREGAIVSGNSAAFVIGPTTSRCRVVYGSDNTDSGASFTKTVKIAITGETDPRQEFTNLRLKRTTSSDVTRIAFDLQEYVHSDQLESSPKLPTVAYVTVNGGNNWYRVSEYSAPGTNGGVCDTSSQSCWLTFHGITYQQMTNNYSATSSNNRVLARIDFGGRKNWFYDGDND